MAQVFQQALSGQPPVDPYQILLAELQKPPAQPRQMFTPEQVAQRIAQNNAQMDLGLLGQMAGDDGIRGVGANIFRQALGNRQERISQRGVMDPLTGEENISPEYQESQDEARRGKILQLAITKQQRDEIAADHRQRQEDAQRHREDMTRLAASLRPGRAGPDPEIAELRKELLRAQVAATEGKADAAADKADATAQKAQTAAQNAVTKADGVIRRVDEALKLTGATSTGLVGQVVGKVPGTPAYDLQKTIDTIKANIGFEELQAMRMASPTGGALGQVAVQELNFLQAVLGNLDRGQSREQVERNLNDVKRHFENWKTVMQQASQEAAARRAPRPSAPAAPGASAPRPGPAPGASAAGGLSPAEQAELEALRQRFGRQ